MYRVANNEGLYCNVFTKPNHSNFSKPNMVGGSFGTTDINVANEYREWLEKIYIGHPFTVVEVSE